MRVMPDSRATGRFGHALFVVRVGQHRGSSGKRVSLEALAQTKVNGPQTCDRDWSSGRAEARRRAGPTGTQVAHRAPGRTLRRFLFGFPGVAGGWMCPARGSLRQLVCGTVAGLRHCLLVRPARHSASRSIQVRSLHLSKLLSKRYGRNSPEKCSEGPALRNCYSNYYGDLDGIEFYHFIMLDYCVFCLLFLRSFMHS